MAGQGILHQERHPGISGRYVWGSCLGPGLCSWQNSLPSHACPPLPRHVVGRDVLMNLGPSVATLGNDLLPKHDAHGAQARSESLRCRSGVVKAALPHQS